MGKSRYADILTHHPMPVVAVILVIVVSCTLLNVFVAKPPDFSDPLQGFMPRHTAIHSSYSTWKNILENTAIGSEAKTLTMYPRTDNSEANLNSVNHMTSLSAGHSITALLVCSSILSNGRPDNGSAVTGAMLRRDLARSRRDLAMLRRDLSEGEEGDMTYDTTTSYLSLMYMKEFSDKEKYFCADRPMERYAQLVFSVDISDISDLSYTHYSKLCELQSLSESSSNYEPVCQRGCHCNSFSLVNYISYLSHQSSCHKVTHKDLNQALQLVVKCRQYYTDLDLDCWYDEVDKFYVKRCNVSAECADKSMYEMYHFILSKPSEAENILVISYLHVAQSVSTHEFYLDIHQLIRQRPPDRGVKLISLDFGLKETVFENSLLTDSGWVGLALAIVVLIMIMYTESVFITFMTFISMLFTIILSFTVYQFVFRIEDFPFMNLLAAIVVVGIGADDLFIFWKTWMAIKHSRNASILERIVTYTFQHAASAMFVTSASTATAFYASAYTDMISIRCFCIYAGTCVLIHYVLVITWLPACVVLYECHSLNVCYSTGKKSKITRLINHLYTASTSTMQRLLERQSEISTLIIWIPLFGLISLAGVIFLTVWPKFTAPSTHMFQMLSASHPFEVYDRDVKPRFDFTSNHEYLPVIFVFGVEPCFNGRYFDLISVGDLVFKPLPEFGSEESQRWFSDFCWNLRQQDFFDTSYSQPHGCFIEEMRAWLRFRSCSSDPICCEDLTFPYNQTVYLHCLDTWNKETSDYQLTTMQPGLRYKEGKPSLVVITFWSNIKFTYNFLQMESFYQNVTSFVDKTMKDCSLSSCDSYRPMVTTAGGWLFYDIQNTLLESLPPTLGVVLSASGLIIFITTQNILLTLCSLISISCSIVTMLGVLSLMRWELNILESVIVSLAVGLSMDFPLHVAVAYRTASSTSDRQTRASLSLRHVGGSLTAAMMTTLVAGICMLPAQVLAYTKLGTFLALVALISWFYATFFMPSLLVRIGHVGNCSQINHKMCRQRRRSSHPGRSHDKTVYSEEISESEIMTTLPTPVPSPHLALEPVIEESEEEISDLEIEDINTSASMSLLTATSPSLKRLTPITECDYDSSESIQS